MIPYDGLKLCPPDGKTERRAYYDGIAALIQRKSDEARENRSRFLSPQKLTADRDGYRAQYLFMLGWPLNGGAGGVLNVHKQLAEENEALKIYRLSLETLPGLWFPGLLFEPQKKDEQAPLVIVNPGGGYCVEDLVAHGDYKCGQYQNMAGRFLEQGCIVYAPQFLLWGCDGMKQPDTRQFWDVKLKAMGSSIAALEIFNVRSAIDHLVSSEPVDPNRIGMMGLSYGGFYAIYIAAAEPRIKVTFASCFFCDRFCSDTSPTGCRSDWLWQNSAHTFFDAEVAALIAPRALYIENGATDELFPIRLSQAEFDRLKPFYCAAGAEDRLVFHIGDNGHSVADGDSGFEFFMSNL